MKRVEGCFIPPDRARHFAKRASPEEVEEVLDNEESPPLWKRTGSFGKSPAYLVFGRTATGRYLFIPGIVLKDPPNRNYSMPATVREMTKDERSYYEQHKGGR